MAPPDLVARRIEVRGVVQGVGFRPFVWRLAERHGVAGRVRNASGVVEIHAEGAPEVLEAFTAAIAGEAPPLARVEAVSWTPAAVERLGGFDVETSVDGVGDRLVSADAATCAACLTELFDPKDRRYRYPFINCTSKTNLRKKKKKNHQLLSLEYELFFLLERPGIATKRPGMACWRVHVLPLLSRNSQP